MTTIFILGDKKDFSFEKLILERLINDYKVNFVKEKSCITSGKGYELLVFDTAVLKTADVESCIAIMKQNSVSKVSALSENAVIIVFSENEVQLKRFKNSKSQIITCGFHKQDTFSYTSLSDDSIVISLNREITALSGKKIQPLEIPVKISKTTDLYPLIAFTALRLLLDDFNSEIGELY